MRYLVTGGGGFLGGAICRQLIQNGHEVISISRGRYPELSELGVQCVQADLSRDLESWQTSFEGVHAVFHVAAKVDMWGDYDSFYAVNVIGTRNIVEACKLNSVSNLVYTSSPSVVADGTNLAGIDETYPYPKTHYAFYPATKAIAEREVLAANCEDLRTLSLRPHLIWGPGDNNFVPTILERARAGRLPRIGPGKNKVDLCYIEDCVEAHILAAKALEEKPSSRGKAYFISQGEPVYLWSWVNDVLKVNGLPAIRKTLPFWVASCAAHLLEAISKIIPGHPEPLLTHFLVVEMATDHYFNISRAEEELGFKPKYSIAEAMELTFGKSV